MTNLNPMKASEDTWLSSVAVMWNPSMQNTILLAAISCSIIPSNNVIAWSRLYWDLFVIQFHSTMALTAKILLILVIACRLMQSLLWNNRGQIKLHHSHMIYCVVSNKKSPGSLVTKKGFPLSEQGKPTFWQTCYRKMTAPKNLLSNRRKRCMI